MSDFIETTRSPRGPGWLARYPKQAAAACGLGYFLVALSGGWLVSSLATPTAAGVAVTVVAAMVLLLSLLLVLSLCRLRLKPSSEVAWVLASMAVFCLVRPSVFAFVGRWLGYQDAGQRIAEGLGFVPQSLLLGNIVLIVWASFLGRLVSRIIREGKLILPVAVVASIADVITVFWGVVARVSEAAPEVVEAFSASAPVEAPVGVTAPILAQVGIGDFLFLALFLSVAIRCSMSAAKTLWGVFAVMLVAPLGFILWPEAPGLPGLPFISAAVLWANWGYLEFTREEKRALAFAGALVGAAALGVWAVFHR